MKWKEWLENWSMTSLKISTPFLEMDWTPRDADKDAAWELYIELLTRTATQPLPQEDGDEEIALKSIYSLFATTRNVIKRHGRLCSEFTKIAIVILNQKIRPFTSKWHKCAVAGGFQQVAECNEFREELKDLQELLSTYTQMLGQMAGVENDLTGLER
jgi:hypothetical protein